MQAVQITDIHTGQFCLLIQGVTVEIITDNGDKMRLTAQQGNVLGDIAPDPPGEHLM